jgi:nicotinic acid mononucleotide adenylyltransferase
MAAPNLSAPNSITGKAVFTTCTSTNAVVLLTNGTASSACLRLTSLAVANIDGSNAADATVEIYNATASGTAYSLAKTLSVPADSTVVIIGRDNPVNLEEDRRVEVQASAADDLAFILSYEEIK